jgi:hypothetical protein
MASLINTPSPPFSLSLSTAVEFSVLRRAAAGHIEFHSLTEKEIADLLPTVDLSSVVTSEAS